MDAATPSSRCGSSFSIKNSKCPSAEVRASVRAPAGTLLSISSSSHSNTQNSQKKLGKSAFECSKHCFANSNMMQKIGVVSCQQTSLETSCNMLSWMHMNSVWLKMIDPYGGSLQTCSLKLVPWISWIEMDSLRCYLNSKSCAPFEKEKISESHPIIRFRGTPTRGWQTISSWSSPTWIHGFLFFVHLEVAKNIQKLSHCIHILASPKWRHRRSDIAGKSMETGNLKLMVRFFSIIIIVPIIFAFVWIQYFWTSSWLQYMSTLEQFFKWIFQKPETSMTWCLSGHPKRSRTPHSLDCWEL